MSLVKNVDLIIERRKPYIILNYAIFPIIHVNIKNSFWLRSIKYIHQYKQITKQFNVY